MGGAIDRLMVLIIDSFDHVTLFSNSGIWKGGIRRRQILQVCFKGANVNRGAVRGFVVEVQRRRDLLDLIEPGELADANAHGVARMNQAVGGRLNAAVGAIGIAGRPISGALYFAGLNRPVANRRAREETIGESEGINE